MNIMSFRGILPQIGEDVYISPSAWIVGDVVIGDRSSVWFNVVIRGDDQYVRIGSSTNIQDNSSLHVYGPRFPLDIGDRVLVGHSAILHGCTVEDECYIGMGSILLDGCKIGKGSVVAAGSLVAPGFQVPPDSVVVGSPGRIRKKTGKNERAMIDYGWAWYVNCAAEYLLEQKARETEAMVLTR